jgi:hypothetical protein
MTQNFDCDLCAKYICKLYVNYKKIDGKKTQFIMISDFVITRDTKMDRGNFLKFVAEQLVNQLSYGSPNLVDKRCDTCNAVYRNNSKTTHCCEQELTLFDVEHNMKTTRTIIVLNKNVVDRDNVQELAKVVEELLKINVVDNTINITNNDETRNILKGLFTHKYPRAENPFELLSEKST